MSDQPVQRLPHRDRPPRVAMPLDEATVIAANAADGILDTSDPDVARVVAQANRVVTRAQMWGTATDMPSRRWRRLLVIGSVVFMAIWIAGLLLPLFTLL